MKVVPSKGSLRPTWTAVAGHGVLAGILAGILAASAGTAQASHCTASFDLDVGSLMVQPSGIAQTVTVDCSSDPECDSYFDITLDAGDTLSLSLCSADGGSATFDTSLAVWDNAGAGASLVCVADNSCDGNRESLDFVAPAGGTYRVVVEGFINVTGTYTLGYEAPVGSDIAGAIPYVDNLKCYGAKTSAGTTKFEAETLTLTDQFESKSTDLTKPALICNAVDLDSGGIYDATRHLECYKSKDSKIPPQPKFDLATPVTVTNIFGFDVLSLKKSQMTCVPTDAGAVPAASGIENFKCYKAGTAKGSPKFAATTVDAADAFLTTSSVVSKPFLLCAPTDKDGEGLADDVTHLACYKVKDETKFAGTTVDTSNALGTETLDAKKAKVLCVPSLKYLAPTCGDDAVNVAGEECDGTADSACDGNCLSDCTCAVCGDGVIDAPIETCESTDDSACPGNCSNCSCDGMLRLVGGGNPAEGRLEVLYAGEWGTVCDDGFDNTDATVACQQLGYTSGVAQCCASFGEGSGQIWMDDLQCTGAEDRLVDCTFSGFGLHNCSHGEDVSVVCTP